MEKTAKISTATALQMEEPSTKLNPISTGYAKLKTKLSTKFKANATTRTLGIAKLRVICRKFSKAFITCIVFYCLGIFFPELREAIPGFYHMVDMFLAGADFCFGALADLLQWAIDLLH